MSVPTAPGGPLVPDDRAGTAVANGVPFSTYAWFFNVVPLWFDSPDPKGDGYRDVPDADYAIPQPLNPAPTAYSLDGVVNGFADPYTGAPTPNPFLALEEYNAFLRANLCDPKSTASGQHAVEVTKPSGAHLDGFITPEGLKATDGGGGAIVLVKFNLIVVTALIPVATERTRTSSDSAPAADSA